MTSKDAWKISTRHPRTSVLLAGTNGTCADVQMVQTLGRLYLHSVVACKIAYISMSCIGSYGDATSEDRDLFYGVRYFR